MKRVLLTTLLAGLFATQAYAADSIKIAITGPFSGGSAPMGTSMRDGAKIAIAEINVAGGIKVGAKMLKFEVLERDDEAKNERGALIAQELASMNDLAGVIGTVNTGVCLAGDKHLQEKGITKIITPEQGTVQRFLVIKQGMVQGEQNVADASDADSWLELSTGECFPLGALLAHRPVASIYRAVMDTFCYELPLAAFHELLGLSAPFRDFCTRRIANLLEHSKQVIHHKQQT